MEEMEKGGGALNNTCVIHASHEGEITSKVPHTQN